MENFIFCAVIHPITSIILLFSLLLLSLIKRFSFLVDNLTLGKASSKLNKVVEPVLSIGCRRLRNIGDFRISTQIKSLFSLIFSRFT